MAAVLVVAWPNATFDCHCSDPLTVAIRNKTSRLKEVSIAPEGFPKKFATYDSRDLTEPATEGPGHAIGGIMLYYSARGDRQWLNSLVCLSQNCKVSCGRKFPGIRPELNQSQM